MDKEQMYNDGIEILEKILKEYFKDKGIDESHEDKYHIGLATSDEMELTTGKLLLRFPINSINEDGTTYLEALPLVSLEDFSIYKYDDSMQFPVKDNNYFCRNIDELKHERYSEEIIKLAHLYYISKRLKSIEEKGTEYKATFNCLCDEMDEYVKFAKEHKESVMKFYKADKEFDKQMENKEFMKNFISQKKEKEENIANKIWKPHNGLRYVTDDSLELAYKLIEKGNLTLKFDFKKYNAIITSNICDLCEKENLTTEKLLEIINSGNNVMDNESIFDVSSNEFVRNGDLLDNVCRDKKCEFQKCPKLLAGYILYLKENNQLEEMLEDRKKFRSANNTNPYFDFEWKIKKGVIEVTDEMYEFCEKLVDNNLVYVENTLNLHGNVTIQSLINCNDYKTCNNDIKKLLEKKSNEGKFLIKKPDSVMDFCSEYSCKLSGCPILIAGYIYYMKKSGKDSSLLADRYFYKEQQQKILSEIKKKSEDTLKSMEENRDKRLIELESYFGIENLKTVLGGVVDSNYNYLNCIVSGKDHKEKENFIWNIINLIKKEKGSINTNNRKMSLREFVGEYAKKLLSKKDIVDNEKYIYVLDGISDFIKLYRKYESKPLQYKYEREAYEYAMDLLTKITPNNYIIVEANPEEVEEFLNISSKVNFTYKDNILKLPETSIEDMFKQYINGLRIDVYKNAEKNIDECRRMFKEYVSLNKKFLSFNDSELINYLINYANNKGNVVFPEDVYKKETIEESLKNIIGLENVKEKLKEFEKFMLFQIKAKNNNINISASNMHMIFEGNPGTGKTTIARIMAKMLFNLGIIKENKLIEVERKDLVGTHIGETAPKTMKIIEKAMGGLLFIDEAYTLSVDDSSKDYGKEAIATLIKAMEDHKDNLVVIFAGYKDEMRNFLHMNPGIASRIGYTFNFKDYSAKELMQIFYTKLNNMNFEYDKNIENKLKRVCEYYCKRRDFGNGRFVDKLIQETVMKHAVNGSDNISLIVEDDIPEIEEMNNSKKDYSDIAQKSLENLIGLKDLKEKIISFGEYVKFLKEANENKLTIPTSNMHMIFTGNPGTGKTTVARIIAKMLFDIGIIYENKLVEVERKDLVGSHIGETAPKTADVIDKAMGGILFVDEAYTLSQGSGNDYGKEAIATLIKAMEDHKDNLIVIFAGYKKEMKDFLNINPGIASRIGYTFEFKDYDGNDLTDIFLKKVEKAGMIVEERAKDEVLKVMKYFSSVENFGNGRFVDKFFAETLMNHSQNKKRIINEITCDEIPTIKQIANNMFNGEHMIDPTKITEEAKKRVAVHEVGHAIAQLLLFKNSGIKKITINAEGSGSLGYVLHNAFTGSYTPSKNELLNKIKVSLAGMASEQLYFGEFESGNSSDLKSATSVAETMITRLGMSSLGFAQIHNEHGEMSEIINKETNVILSKCFDEVTELLNKNKDRMDSVIEYLMDKTEIDEEELINAFN